jgi:hypothetical protein
MSFILSSSTEDSPICQKVFEESLLFFLVKNVSHIKQLEKTFNSFEISTFESSSEYSSEYSSDKSINYYLFFETMFSEAFAHFTFESVIYLPFFRKLKSRFPQLKIVIQHPKIFKNLYFKLFEISDDEIVTSIDPNKPNYVLFPEPISCLNDKSLNKTYQNLVENLFRIFRLVPFNTFPKVPFLIMPRQTRENFWGNPRDLPLIQIIDHFKTKNNGLVFHTDNVTDFKDQMSKLDSSEKIIITDGSPMLVNGLFTRNKHFLIVDTVTQYQSNNYPKYRFLINMIEQFNCNKLTYFKDEIDCLSYLSSLSDV